MENLVSNFYYLGRLDSLKKLMPNPMSAGTSSPQEFNDYMNGYNSVINKTSGIDIRKFLKRLLIRN